MSLRCMDSPHAGRELCLRALRRLAEHICVLGRKNVDQPPISISRSYVASGPRTRAWTLSRRHGTSQPRTQEAYTGCRTGARETREVPLRTRTPTHTLALAAAFLPWRTPSSARDQPRPRDGDGETGASSEGAAARGSARAGHNRRGCDAEHAQGSQRADPIPPPAPGARVLDTAPDTLPSPNYRRGPTVGGPVRGVGGGTNRRSALVTRDT